MPRALRPSIPGAIYHITARGNNRDPVVHGEHDPVQYLALLGRTRDRYKLAPIAYALLTNHVHLVVRDIDGNISAAMRYLHGCYASWVNRFHHRGSHLFGARFASRLIDSDAYLLEVTRYVHLNPVRAGLTPTPHTYPWSSYQAFIADGARQALVDPSAVLDLLAADRTRARDAYRRFVEDSTVRPAPPSPEQGASNGLVTIRDLILRMRSLSEPRISTHSLTARERAVFLHVARVLTSCSIGELAAFLGMNANSIPSALARLRSKLRVDPSLAEQVNALLSQLGSISGRAPGQEFRGANAKTE